MIIKYSYNLSYYR